jgi:hypothetical protein
MALYISCLDKFKAKHGYTPNIETPKRFSEKLLRRIMLDRDPFYHFYANKLFAPDFVSGCQVNDLHIALRYRITSHLTPADFDALPNQFVIKSAYGSGLNEIVKDKTKCDREAICNRFNTDLHQKQNAQGAAYHYNCAIFEEYLGDPLGEPPNDFKFHCFRKPDGSYHSILQIDSDRFGSHRQSFFDETFEPLPLRFDKEQLHEVCPSRPNNFDQMTRIAKQLARGFDYIRVDLYLIGQKIYFGEITPFHRGGMSRISPDEWDLKLGAMWHQTTPCYRRNDSKG